jgi:uncharacterized protein (UPF0218 family)
MDVHATVITPTTIEYECPTCWFDRKTKRTCTSQYGKDRRVVRSRVPGTHVHGNPFGDRNNRVEDRTSHCLHTTLRDVFIVIDDKTRRFGFPKNHKAVRFYDIDEIMDEEGKIEGDESLVK